RQILKSTDRELRVPSLSVGESVVRFLSGKSKGRRVSLRGADIIRDRARMVVIRPKGQDQASDRRPAIPVAGPVPVLVPSTVYWPGTGQEIHVERLKKQG